MPTLHNRERDTSDYSDQRSDYQRNDDREISLGTGTILAIFFALALVCAVFFGLGYSMGRKSTQLATVSAASTSAPVSSSTFSNFKPAAGSPANQPSATSKKDPEAAIAAPSKDPDGEIVTTPVTSSEESSTSPRTAAATRKDAAQETSAAPIVRQTPQTAPATSQSTAMPAISPNGTAMVQVAAVSHQEDADTLIAALKKRGYTVFVRNEPQDKLLHVQLGPFATKKDADAVRQHLLSDGYNAIVK
jgi:cell division septation protein DedD